MKKIALFCGLLIMGLMWASTSSAQRQGSALAAVPVPGQPVTPATPTPTAVTPQVPGVPRPATPTAAGAKPEEQLRVVADTATNSLIIYGTAQEFQNIKNILKDLDIIPRQVLMDVLVAEVTLTDTESLGVTYELFAGSTSIFGQTFRSAGALVPVPGSPGVVPSGPVDTTGNIIAGALTGFPTGLSGIVGRASAVRAFINALATQNRIKALASPSVLATDNRPARIQVGSEIPVLTSTTQSIIANSQQVNTVGYRNTGVILTIIPQVNSLGLVNLQVKQEVSDVGANSFGNTNSPSFTTRDAETTAIVQDGETLVIGGMISERKTRDRNGIPYLMDLPVVGRFLGTTSDNTTRTELVILITPHVVRNKDEARNVTEEFKSRLSDVRNELERFESERAKAKAKPLPQPGAVKPDVKPPPPAPAIQMPQSPTPSPSPVTPMPGASVPGTPTPVPVPGRAPGVSMAPTNLAPVPSQQVVSATSVSSNTAAKPPPEVAVRIEAKSNAGETTPPFQEAETYATETDAVGTLLKAIETNDAESPSTAKPVPQTVKPAQVWVVQIASFVTDKEAQTLANKLRGKGYDANVATAEVGGRTWYRVEVGRLASRNDARELQKNLQSTEKIEQSIIASR